MAAQRDGTPVGGFRPTSTWTLGGTIKDHQGLLLPPDLRAGRYELWAGLYDGTTGDRLRARLPSGGESDHLVLSAIEVD